MIFFFFFCLFAFIVNRSMGFFFQKIFKISINPPTRIRRHRGVGTELKIDHVSDVTGFYFYYSVKKNECAAWTPAEAFNIFRRVEVIWKKKRIGGRKQKKTNPLKNNKKLITFSVGRNIEPENVRECHSIASTRTYSYYTTVCEYTPSSLTFAQH